VGLSVSSGGILLLDKPKGWTSFDCVAKLRRRLGVQKIGHAGTLDPFATGVLVLLIGRAFTAQADHLQGQDKSYWMRIRLGQATDTFDSEGKIVAESPTIPTLEQLETALQHFQGEVEQIPPMFSAKKVNGQKLYHLARQGKEVQRAPVVLHLSTALLSYDYPFVEVEVECSKGAYMRSIAHDLGQLLGCGAHALELSRTRSGPFHLKDCLSPDALVDPECDLASFLIQEIPSGASLHNRHI
jgi:tRNA pseudouridine55 synthase